MVEGRNAFFDAFWIIIRPATGLRPLHHPLHQGLLATLEVDEVPNDHLIRQLLLEDLPVLLIPWEAVDEVSPVAVGSDGGVE